MQIERQSNGQLARGERVASRVPLPPFVSSRVRDARSRGQTRMRATTLAVYLRGRSPPHGVPRLFYVTRCTRARIRQL